MAGLTKDIIHYVKFDIKKWQGPVERIEMKQSMTLTTVTQQQYFTWAFTQQRREWKNSVIQPQRAEDADWEGWQLALDLWTKHREDYGNKVKLWIAKPTFTLAYVPGNSKQTKERLPESVAIMAYLPETDRLWVTVIQQGWIDELTLDRKSVV